MEDVMKIILKLNHGSNSINLIQFYKSTYNERFFLNFLFLFFIYLKENKTLYMKDKKNALLYSDSFHENNMFDFERNNKLYYVSEVLRYENIIESKNLI